MSSWVQRVKRGKWTSTAGWPLTRPHLRYGACCRSKKTRNHRLNWLYLNHFSELKFNFETEKEMIILGSELLSLKSWEQEEAQSKLFSPPDKEDLGKTSAPSLTKGVFGCGGIAVFCHKLEGGGWTGSWCPDVEMVSHGRISRHEHVLSSVSYNEFVNSQAWGNGPHTCNYSRFCVLSAIWVWCSPLGFNPNFRRLWKQNPNLFFSPLSSSSSFW